MHTVHVCVYTYKHECVHTNSHRTYVCVYVRTYVTLLCNMCVNHLEWEIQWQCHSHTVLD